MTVELGKIIYGRDLGHLGKRASQRWIGAECPDCGKIRWAVYAVNRTVSRRYCQRCNIVRQKDGFKIGRVS
jgi:hypothetical protein